MALPTRARRVLRSIRNAIPSGVFLGRTSPGEGPAEFIPITEATNGLLDNISAVQGSVLYRNAIEWVALSPGTDEHLLTTKGSAADPIWSDPLDTISTTQGTILYRNATAWVALSPGTSGHFLQTLGASNNPQWAAAAGGDGGLAFFTGFSVSEDAGTSTLGHATRGTIFIPDSDLTVTHVQAEVDPTSSGNTYKGVIAEMSDATASATVSSVIGFTADNSNGHNGTDEVIIQREFASPVTLDADTVYFIGMVITSGSGTTALRPGFASEFMMNAPGETPLTAYSFSSITIAATDGYDATATNNCFMVSIRGTFTA